MLNELLLSPGDRHGVTGSNYGFWLNQRSCRANTELLAKALFLLLVFCRLNNLLLVVTLFYLFLAIIVLTNAETDHREFFRKLDACLSCEHWEALLLMSTSSWVARPDPRSTTACRFLYADVNRDLAFTRRIMPWTLGFLIFVHFAFGVWFLGAVILWSVSVCIALALVCIGDEQHVFECSETLSRWLLLPGEAGLATRTESLLRKAVATVEGGHDSGSLPAEASWWPYQHNNSMYMDCARDAAFWERIVTGGFVCFVVAWIVLPFTFVGSVLVVGGCILAALTFTAWSDENAQTISRYLRLPGEPGRNLQSDLQVCLGPCFVLLRYWGIEQQEPLVRQASVGVSPEEMEENREEMIDNHEEQLDEDQEATDMGGQAEPGEEARQAPASQTQNDHNPPRDPRDEGSRETSPNVHVERVQETPLAQRVDREAARPARLQRIAYEDSNADDAFFAFLCIFSVLLWLLQFPIHDGGLRSALIGKICVSLLASQGVACLAASTEANAKTIARLLLLPGRQRNAETTIAVEKMTFWFDSLSLVLYGVHRLLLLQQFLDGPRFTRSTEQSHHQHRHQQPFGAGADERPQPVQTTSQQWQQDSNIGQSHIAAESWEGADNTRPDLLVMASPQPARASSMSKCRSMTWIFIKTVIFGVTLGGVFLVLFQLLMQSSGVNEQTTGSLRPVLLFAPISG